MGVIAKQGIKNTIWSYIGVVIGYVNVVLLFPNFFTPEEYGLTRVLLDIATIYAQFSAFGLNHVILRHYPQYNRFKKSVAGFMFFVHSWMLIGFLAVSFLFFLLQSPIYAFFIDSSPLIIEYAYYLFPLGFFILYFNVLDAYSRSRLESVFPSFLKDVLLRIAVTGLISLYALDMLDFEMFLLLFVGANCSIAVLQMIYLFRKKYFSLKVLTGFFKPERISPIVQFGAFSLISGISTVLVGLVDKVMLAGMIDLEVVAIYTTSFFMASAIMVPSRSLNKIVFPIVSDKWIKKDLDGVENLYKKTSVANILIGGFIFIGIAVNLPYIYEMMPPVYAEGFLVFVLIGIGKIFDTATSINFMILSVSDKYRYDTYFNGGLLFLMILLNYFFITLYGITGAALASMISLVLLNSIRVIVLYRHFKLSPVSPKTLPAVTILVLTFFAGWIIPGTAHFIVNILIKSIVMATVFGVLAWRYRMLEVFYMKKKM